MRILAPSAAGHAGDAGSSLYKTLQIPPKTAVLSVGLLFCPFCFCYGWLACRAVLVFFALVFGSSGARARDPSHKTLLFTVFCCICVSGLACGLFFLGCCFRGLWRARATPCQPSGLGPGWGLESWLPGHGWGGQHA